MPQDFNIVSRKFYTQLKNGADFTLNPNDFTLNLACSIGERMKAVFEVEVFNSAHSTSGSVFTAGGNSVFRQSGSFIADKFDVGDTIDVIDLVPTYTALATGRTITGFGLNGGELKFSGLPISSVTSINMWVQYKTPLTAFEFDFGILENSQPFNFVSKIDGSDQRYQADGISPGIFGGRTPATVTATRLGVNQSWVTGNVDVSFVSDTVTFNASPYTQTFKIEHEFIVLPFFLEGDLPTISIGQQPAILSGANSLKYEFDAGFLRVFNNQNSKIKAKERNYFGDVGGFGERFNGLNSQYSITTMEYYEDAAFLNPVDSLQVSADTYIRIVINSADSTFNVTNTKFVLNHSFLPTTVEMGPSIDTFQGIWRFDQKLQTAGAAPVSSSIIKDLETTFASTSSMTIRARISYSVQNQQILTNLRDYLLWVTIENHLLTNETSDRVPVLADDTKYTESPDVQNLFLIDDKFEIRNWATVPPFTGTSDFPGWNRDLVQCYLPFFLHQAIGAILQSLSVSLAVYNSTTGDSFILDTYTFDLSSQVINTQGGLIVQNWNINTLGGFDLDVSDPLNIITLANDNLFATGYSYEATIPFVIRFEDFIPNPNVDSVFYDNAEPNNNLNFKASNYSALNGYNIVFFVDAVIFNGISNTAYRGISADCLIFDSALGGTGWVVTTIYKNQSGVDIGKNLLNQNDTENTVVEATFTKAGHGLLAIDGWAAMQPEQSSGGAISWIHTSKPGSPNSALIPLPLSSFIDVTINANDIIFEFEVDHTKVVPGQGYELTYRLA